MQLPLQAPLMLSLALIANSFPGKLSGFVSRTSPARGRGGRRESRASDPWAVIAGAKTEAWRDLQFHHQRLPGRPAGQKLTILARGV